jgi:anoctamin-10
VLCTSHGFLVAHAVIRHLLEKIIWEGDEEAERNMRAVNEQYLKRVEGNVDWEESFGGDGDADYKDSFWGYE